jgi:hypothetical protein
MPFVHFSGATYTGFDGETEIQCDQPGLYEVSAVKAEQLTTDFPDEFSPAVEGEIVDEPAQEGAKSDDAQEPAEEAADKDKKGKKS